MWRVVGLACGHAAAVLPPGLVQPILQCVQWNYHPSVSRKLYTLDGVKRHPRDEARPRPPPIVGLCVCACVCMCLCVRLRWGGVCACVWVCG